MRGAGMATRLTTGKTFLAALVPTIAALAVQFVVFAIVARGLGITQFGQYTVILAVAAVCVDVVGIGTADLFARAVVTDRSRHAVAWGQILVVSALTWPLVAGLATLFVWGILPVSLSLPWIGLAVFGEILVSRAQASVENVMVAYRQPARAGWVRFWVFGARLIAAYSYFILLNYSSLQGWIAAVAIQATLVIHHFDSCCKPPIRFSVLRYARVSNKERLLFLHRPCRSRSSVKCGSNNFCPVHIC